MIKKAILLGAATIVTVGVVASSTHGVNTDQFKGIDENTDIFIETIVNPAIEEVYDEGYDQSVWEAAIGVVNEQLSHQFEEIMRTERGE